MTEFERFFRGNVGGLTLPMDDRTLANAMAMIARKESEKQEKQTEKIMKTKNFYHTFDFEGREVTLLLHVREVEAHPLLMNHHELHVTYAVRLHEDEKVEGLTKKILQGRIDKEKLLDKFEVDDRFAYKLAYLKGLAHCFENEIKRGDMEIVGLLSGIRKDRENEVLQAQIEQ